MYARFIGLLAMVPFGSMVDAHRSTPKSHHHHHRIARKTYSLQDWYQGSDFFTQWTFFTDPDPTHGNVNYVDMLNAISQGLAYVNVADNSVVLAVDSKSSDVPEGGKRNSVRITSNKDYTGGLFILDAIAMPVGCGIWPSFWSFGPNWPMAGEIDIVEGVNNQANNQMTLHTGTLGVCGIDTSHEGAFTGRTLNANCTVTPSSNAGCSILDTSANSFAQGFNTVQGGVFAMLWDTMTGISVWYFPRGNIPADIPNRMPTPANWGRPAAFWSATSCDIVKNFYRHSLVFDTTICGDWAGTVYSKSGCPGTCAKIVANADNFIDAKWRINYVAVYE